MAALTLEQVFPLALGHHQAGRLAEAEAMYRQILAVHPNHAEALHLLGVLAAGAGTAAAICWISVEVRAPWNMHTLEPVMHFDGRGN